MSSPYDLVGAVLPQALRLARYQACARLPQTMDDVQTENDTLKQTPSREEERLLVSNASIMTALEDLFSWRQKDRTCRTSKLSRIESVRFQRAMYRLWLMSALFGPRRFDRNLETAALRIRPLRSPSGFADDPEEDYYTKRQENLDKSWKDQKTFLEQFSSHEVFQIRKLAWFLNGTVFWAVIADRGGADYTYDWDGMYLFAGPHAVLRCYEDATISHLPLQYLDDDGPYTDFLKKPYSEICKERQVTEPRGVFLGLILDDIHGLHDKCHHCGSAGTMGDMDACGAAMLPGLFNETNWDDLKGQLERQFLLPQNLCFNPLEKPILQAMRGDWAQLFRELFACKRDEYTGWSKDDWICNSCLTLFFRDTIWVWRLEQKRKAHQPIGEDCKRGYDCAEQHNEKHAKRFNHLCKPKETVVYPAPGSIRG